MKTAMKKPTSSPLTAAEIRAGIARLMSSPFMQSPEGRRGDDGKEDDFSGALYTAGDVNSNRGPSLWSFAETWGLEGNVPGVIEDLGIALLKQRLSVEELFRLGTSEEAVRLLEEEEALWVASLKALHPERASAGGAS